MKFIYSIQNIIPEDCNDYYRNGYPSTEACNIFNYFITNLELVKDITEIIVLLPSNAHINLYNQIFRDFSYRIQDYSSTTLFQLIFELDIFPHESDMIDSKLATQISRLINNVEFINFSQDKIKVMKKISSTPTLLDYDYSKVILNSLSKNDYRFIDYVSFKKASAKIQNEEGYLLIKADEYFRIKTILEEINYDKDYSYSSADYYFRPQTDILDLINKPNKSELFSIKSKNNKKLKFITDDNYLSKSAADKITEPFYCNYYNLEYELPTSLNNDQAILLDNLDSLDKEKFNKITRMASEAQDKAYIIFKTLISNNPYVLGNFKAVEFPRNNDIAELITNIFISLLYKNASIEKKLFSFKPLISTNALSILLKNHSNISNLSLAINQLGQISADDLISNVPMWYYIFSKLETKHLPVEIKTKIVIEKRDTTWLISGYSPIPFTGNLWMLYIATIILHQQIHSKMIKAIDLRKVILRITGADQKLSELESEIKSCRTRFEINDISEHIRKIIGDSLSKKDNLFYTEFMQNYYNYHNFNYGFHENNKVEFDIQFEELNNIIIHLYK